VSDDGRLALVIIAFIGSVFSPYYARARRRGPADPMEHCALNVVVYGAGRQMWAMTEFAARHCGRDATRLDIGGSRLGWSGGRLTIDIDERLTPGDAPLRGRVTVDPDALTDQLFPLDADGLHVWTPLAPRARVTVELSEPGLSFAGDGYLDGNAGERPVAADFVSWDWSRSCHAERATVLYDARRRDGSRLALALASDADGAFQPIAAPATVALPRSRWRMPRLTGADAGATPRLTASLEDTPFYARSLIEADIGGEPILSVHETLDCDRLASRWVEALLPARMPRVD
jgi:carotenoid 1,2-hydratase